MMWPLFITLAVIAFILLLLTRALKSTKSNSIPMLPGPRKGTTRQDFLKTLEEEFACEFESHEEEIVKLVSKERGWKMSVRFDIYDHARHTFLNEYYDDDAREEVFTLELSIPCEKSSWPENLEMVACASREDAINNLKRGGELEFEEVNHPRFTLFSTGEADIEQSTTLVSSDVFSMLYGEDGLKYKSLKIQMQKLTLGGVRRRDDLLRLHYQGAVFMTSVWSHTDVMNTILKLADSVYKKMHATSTAEMIARAYKTIERPAREVTYQKTLAMMILVASTPEESRFTSQIARALRDDIACYDTPEIVQYLEASMFEGLGLKELARYSAVLPTKALVHCINDRFEFTQILGSRLIPWPVVREALERETDESTAPDKLIRYIDMMPDRHVAEMAQWLLKHHSASLKNQDVCSSLVAMLARADRHAECMLVEVFDGRDTEPEIWPALLELADGGTFSNGPWIELILRRNRCHPPEYIDLWAAILDTVEPLEFTRHLLEKPFEDSVIVLWAKLGQSVHYELLKRDKTLRWRLVRRLIEFYNGEHMEPSGEKLMNASMSALAWYAYDDEIFGENEHFKSLQEGLKAWMGYMLKGRPSLEVLDTIEQVARELPPSMAGTVRKMANSWQKDQQSVMGGALTFVDGASSGDLSLKD